MSQRTIMVKKVTAEQQPFHFAFAAMTEEKKVKWYQEKLARHLLVSFEGTVDDQGEDLAQWQLELEEAFQGKYGPLLTEHSFYHGDSDDITGSVIVALFRDIPLVIYLAVESMNRGTGLAQELMQRMLDSFIGTDYQHVFLVVTDENSAAKRLYERLGFEAAGTDWDTVLTERDFSN
jgi:ribosomal protein S18 acetylase RimI-like enzyme